MRKEEVQTLHQRDDRIVSLAFRRQLSLPVLLLQPVVVKSDRDMVVPMVR